MCLPSESEMGKDACALACLAALLIPVSLKVTLHGPFQLVLHFSSVPVGVRERCHKCPRTDLERVCSGRGLFTCLVL